MHLVLGDPGHRANVAEGRLSLLRRAGRTVVLRSLHDRGEPGTHFGEIRESTMRPIR
jgi:hypothetical protein